MKKARPRRSRPEIDADAQSDPVVRRDTRVSLGRRLLHLDRAARKAKVALARKLAVVLHRMPADGTSFIADKAAAAR
jgi:hypothetical protein